VIRLLFIGVIIVGSEVAGEYICMMRSFILFGKKRSAAIYLPFDDEIF